MQKISGLFTDLYQLTMAQAYLEAGKRDEVATFDLFVRRLPDRRNYLVFAGLPEALDYLTNLYFEKDDIQYLSSLKMFSKEFLEYLRRFRFTGDVLALEEGEIFFAKEPILRIQAPLIEAQLVETALINIINIHSLLASKASRVVQAARGKSIVDFGLRRAHGQTAGNAASYSSYLVGASGTSNMLAGKYFGIPVFGTMAHSYVKSFPDERESFLSFAHVFPKNATLLIDTYDTVEGAKRAIEVARILEKEGIKINGVRLDSGDRIVLSKKVRMLLDRAGMKNVKIFVSGDLDEYKIEEYERVNAPIDAYGVGTAMVTSADAPSLEIVYKLAQIKQGGIEYPKMKLSTGKKTLPGAKQVIRGKGKDVIALFNEKVGGTPLLRTVMKKGKRIAKLKSLKEARIVHTKKLAQFPKELLSLDKKYQYPVEVSSGIQDLINMLK